MVRLISKEPHLGMSLVCTADKLGLSVGTEDGSYGIGSYGIEGAWLGMELGDDDGCDEGCILIYLDSRLVEMSAN